MSSIASRILAADDLKREPVKAWGEDFFVRVMTGLERELYEKNLFKADGSGDLERGRIRATLLVFCAVDAEGKPLFTEADIDALAGKSSAELIRVARIAQKLNGLSAEAEAEAGKK